MDKAKKTIKLIGVNDPDPADAPNAKIENIAEVSIANIDGTNHIMLVPIDNWESFMDFDRNATKLGVKSFIRPVMSEEIGMLPPGFEEAPITHMLVSGNASVRSRVGITF